MKIVVAGASGLAQTPGLEAIAGDCQIAFAPDSATFAAALEGSEILLAWDFRGGELRTNWDKAGTLKWVHRCGAGVEGMVFPEMVNSDIVLTNARGVFDRGMAEYVLAVILARGKNLHANMASQRVAEWRHRKSQLIVGTRALVFGVGSIGTEVGRLLRAAGIHVEGVGRTARPGGEVFEKIHAAASAERALAAADWVVSVMPSTAESDGFFNAARFAAMRRCSLFINIGRGAAVDEKALVEALNSERIGGAAIDVFAHEPLPAGDPLWTAKNIVISAHSCGDYVGFEQDLVALFLDNLARYRAGAPLRNIVEKSLGYSPSERSGS